MRINLKIIFKTALMLMALLTGSATARAQDAEETGYALSTRCIPADAASTYPNGESYAAGSSVNVYCSANSGFRFIRWEDEEGNEVSTSSDFYYTMPAHDVALTARFEYNPDSPEEPSVPVIKKYATVRIECLPSNGGYFNVYGADSQINDTEWKFEIGARAEIYELGHSGYRFVNWTENGEEISTLDPLVFTVEEGGRNLVANFVYDPSSPDEPGEQKFYRMLTLKSNPEGAASSLSGAGEYINGSTVNVYGYANPYYIFDNWTDQDGNIVSEVLDFNYTMPIRHVTLTANFHYDFNPANPDEPGSPSIDDNGTVGRPRITMQDDTHILILCSTPGATIHYTLDGTEPTTASEVYTDAVFVPGNITVKAIAVKEGMTPSVVTTFQVNSYRAALPLITFESGKIKIITTTPDATIHYTLDNSDPTPDSPVYTEPLEADENLLYKAIACYEGLTDSDVAVYVFNRADHTMEGPSFTLLEDGRLQITPAVSDAEIRYTVDGTDPTILSHVYAAPLQLEGNFTVKAIAIHTNYFDSPVSEYVMEGFVVERPTMTYANRALSISVATAGASIRYTVDGSIPTESSTLYSQPLNLTEDCKVVAKGFKENYEPSDTISYLFVYADHQVATPIVTYDSETRTITMTCATEDASIRYTTNGETPTATTGTAYSAPFVVDGNKTFTVRAFRNDLFDSETATYAVEEQTVPVPTASFANRRLTLSCSDAEAAIHYTLDGTDPTAASTRYAGAIELSEDCTVKFIGVRAGYRNSEVATYNFVYADHQVAKPTVSYDPATKTVTMTCTTEEASIRYTTTGEAPTATTGTAYSAPFVVDGNKTFTVRAFRNDLFDSEITTYAVDDQKVPTPTARYSAHSIYLECSDPLAEIHYTEDGSQPTAASTLYYEAPINVSEDRTIRFIAIREGFNDSEEASFTFTYADWMEAEPEITVDYRGRKVHFRHPDGLPLRLEIDGEEQTIQTPDSIDVVPEMENIKFQALATDEDRYDSGLHNFQIIFLQKPQLSYDGHAVHYAPAEGDLYADGCEGWVYVNGELRRYGSATGEMEMLEFCNVSVHLESDDAFRSDDAEVTIDFYNTGRVAGARNGHRLAEAFGEWGDSKEDYSYLRINGGEVNAEDLKFIATLPNLTTLHLSPNIVADESYDGVLADTRIETIFSYSYPEGMLKGMPRLTTVMWGLTNSKMPEGRLTEAGNPNILLWLTDKANAPADARNMVVYDYIGEGFPTDPEGTGIEGTAESISLQAGYPFHPHMPLHVEGTVDLTKDFRQETIVGECQGWETLVLPFAPTGIKHAVNGNAVPFAAWDGDIETAKPFWLYGSTSDGWKPADAMQAYTPYILSMPNSADYMDQAILAGKVTFSASNVDLTPDGEPEMTPWVDGTHLEGTFMPVEEASIHSLNVGSTAGGMRPGSAFVPDGETLPFGAYVKGASRRAMPLFGGSNGVDLPTVGDDGLTVETPAPGMLRISSMRERTVAVCTMTGVTVRTLHLTAGESVTLEGLTCDLYLVGGRKVMVR